MCYFKTAFKSQVFRLRLRASLCHFGARSFGPSSKFSWTPERYCTLVLVSSVSWFLNHWSRRLAYSTCGGGRRRSWNFVSPKKAYFSGFYGSVWSRSLDQPLVLGVFREFWPRQLACAMHSLAIVITIVQSLFLSLSPSFAFYPLWGNSCVRNNPPPPIFWHN